MQYQVVVRPCLPTAGKWDYYPYLVPGRDKSAAERMARYAAQNGYEAAILQSVTVEMLVNIARAVVEHQDERLLPLLRYLPGARVGMTRSEHDGDPRLTALTAPVALEPYFEGPTKSELDARRSSIEMGPGGDVDAGGRRRGERPSFPQRMDVVGTWLRLRERVVLGQLGGAADGTYAVDVEDAS